MVVFHKICRIARSSGMQETESLSVMGHARSAAVSSRPSGADLQKNLRKIPKTVISLS